jgi:uncharacterized protein with PQ loop repeat
MQRTSPDRHAPSVLERMLPVFSIVTMACTLPQVLAVWVEKEVAGVSIISWTAYLVSACLWFVYGLQKRDKTIYLACIGWIAMDAAIVAGVLLYRQ